MFTYQPYTVARVNNKNMHGETYTTIKVTVHSEYEPYRSNSDNFDTNPLRIIQTTSRTILYRPYKTQPAATHISSIQSELRYAPYESQAEWSDSWRGEGRIRQISRTLSYPFEPLRTIHTLRIKFTAFPNRFEIAIRLLIDRGFSGVFFRYQLYTHVHFNGWWFPMISEMTQVMCSIPQLDEVFWLAIQQHAIQWVSITRRGLKKWIDHVKYTDMPATVQKSGQRIYRQVNRFLWSHLTQDKMRPEALPAGD